MAHSPPSVCLVTVLYNSEDGVPDFLASLLAQTLREWRLVVVDNASADRARALVEACGDPRISVVANRSNFGFAKAANQGLVEAVRSGSDFFVLINNDTSFGPDFLRDFVAVREDAGASVLAPRIMRRRDPGRTWYAGGHLERGWALRSVHEDHDPSDTRAYRTVQYATGCCLGITRSALERVGLLDESFFVYWEDADFCLRLEQAAIPVTYCREPMLLHEGGAASGGEFTRSYNRHFYRSYAQLLRKHFGLRHAVPSLLRLAKMRVLRRTQDWRTVPGIVAATLAGLFAPLRPEPRLAPATARAGVAAGQAARIGVRHGNDREEGMSHPR